MQENNDDQAQPAFWEILKKDESMRDNKSEEVIENCTLDSSRSFIP